MVRIKGPGESAGRRDKIHVALFDSSTLLGKGVKSHLKRRKFPLGSVRLFDTGAMEEGGNLAEFAGEAMLAVRPALAELAPVDLAFYCGPSGTGSQYLDWPTRGKFTAIDLTLAANRRREVPVVNAAVNPERLHPHQGLLASPHPISQFLSTLLAPLARRLPVTEAVSLVLQPASEAGELGLEELYRQTVGVLNFTEVPREQFGRVLAFNLLPYEPGTTGGISEEEIGREIGAILGPRSFPQAVRVLQAPVFHCHSFLCRVRFAAAVEAEKIREVLSEEPSVSIRPSGEGATPAELAGAESIVVGELRPDGSVPHTFWFWGITDNLATGVALNAVRMAEVLLDSGALGKERPA